MAYKIEGQLINTSQQMGLASLPDYINHYVGASPQVISDPRENAGNNAASYMIVNVEKGSFRIQVGDTTATIGSYEVPSSLVDDGTGSLPLEEFETYVFTSPDKFTIVGSASDAVLTVGWL